jgi:hypothetical protein
VTFYRKKLLDGVFQAPSSPVLLLEFIVKLKVGDIWRELGRAGKLT